MGSRKRLLIVDDEKELCELLKTRLENNHLEVLLAYHVDEGFEKLLRENPDCILLDIKLSKGEDGLTFLRRVRSFRHEDPKEQERIRRKPVIILTGSGEGMRELFRLEGANDFVLKPFDAQDLEVRIRRLLGQT